MPWAERSVMQERLCFVARLLEGEPMTELRRQLGIRFALSGVTSMSSAVTQATVSNGSRCNGAHEVSPADP